MKVEIEIRPGLMGYVATGKVKDGSIVGIGNTVEEAEADFIRCAKEFLAKQKAFTKTIEL